MIYCAKCGAGLDEGDAFCKKCGNPVDSGVNTYNRTGSVLEHQRNNDIRELDKMINYFSKDGLYPQLHYRDIEVYKLSKANLKRKKNARKLKEALAERAKIDSEINERYREYGFCPVDKEHADPEKLAKIKDAIVDRKADSIKEAVNLIDRDERDEDFKNQIAQMAQSTKENEGSNNSGCASFLIGFFIVMLVIAFALVGIVFVITNSIQNYVNANMPQMVDEYNRPYVTSLEQLSEDDINLLYEHAKEYYVSRLKSETVNSIELVNVYLYERGNSQGNQIYIVIKPNITYTNTLGDDETYEYYFFVAYTDVAIEEDGSVACDLDNAYSFNNMYYPSEQDTFYYLTGVYEDEQSLLDNVGILYDTNKLQETMNPVEGQ